MTRPGRTNAELKIQLRGSGTEAYDGLTLGNDVSDCAIRGLAIDNFRNGIFLRSSGSGNSVEGSFIGTDASGTSAAGNGLGVYVAFTDDSILGGASPGERNLISGNGSFGGVSLDESDRNTIQGNLIGTGKNGSRLGNEGIGVTVDAFTSGAINNPILSNSILSNGGLGIDLNADGPTHNDSNDSDIGPNNRQNYPVITSATTSSGGPTTIRGKFEGTLNRSLVLQFFGSPAADPSGFGEGRTFVGETLVTTDSNGDARFDFTPATPIGEGQVVTATATDNVTGDTSEFSAARTVAAPLPNDDFADALTISGSTVSVSGTNVNATREPGEPDHVPNDFDSMRVGERSVWYRWTAPASGQTTIETCANDFPNPVLGVYTGDALGSLTAVASNTIGCGGSAQYNRVTFDAQAGTTYRIAAGGYFEDSDEGTFTLTVTEKEPPRVVRVAPEENATGIGLGANVNAFFSEAMRSSTINPNTVKLFEVGKTIAIEAMVTYDAARKQTILNPNANLRPGVKYKAVVTLGARDVAGNPLDQDPNVAGSQPKTWRFTVRP